MVLACDGIFDVMSNQEAGTLVARHLSDGGGVREGCGALIKRAFAKKSDDNLTAVIALCVTRLLHTTVSRICWSDAGMDARRFDYGESDSRSVWLGPMREKRAAAEREEQRAADLKKVKHDSAQPQPILVACASTEVS